MDAICLHERRIVAYAINDGWQQDKLVLIGELAVDIIELICIVGSIIGRQLDAQQHNLCVIARSQAGHVFKVLPQLCQGQAT